MCYTTRSLTLHSLVHRFAGVVVSIPIVFCSHSCALVRCILDVISSSLLPCQNSEFLKLFLALI